LAKLPLCPPTVTTTVTAPAACAGVVAVIVVLFTTTTLVAAVPPNVTVAPAAKFVPVIVTAVPPAVGPLLGVRLLTNGILLGFADGKVRSGAPLCPGASRGPQE